jgi:ElaB/YqjD/DUF883 family membrane-anchored ribosome-binding protein
MAERKKHASSELHHQAASEHEAAAHHHRQAAYYHDHGDPCRQPVGLRRSGDFGKVSDLTVFQLFCKEITTMTAPVRTQKEDQRKTEAGTWRARERMTLPPAEGTAPGLGGMLENISEGVKESVKTVNDAVTETAANVGEAVHDTVESVRGLFDLSGLVRQQPWALLAVSVAVGFLLGRFLSSRRGR